MCAFVYVWSEVLRPFIPLDLFAHAFLALRLSHFASCRAVRRGGGEPEEFIEACVAPTATHLPSLLRPPLTESRFHDSITVRPCLPHTYMSKQTCSRPLQLPCPLPCSPSHPFVRNRTVAPSSVPQLVVLRVSCEWGPACSQGLPMPSCFC